MPSFMTVFLAGSRRKLPFVEFEILSVRRNGGKGQSINGSGRQLRNH
jgi:hypothetical protein